VSLHRTALVANETGRTSNPGCRAVRRGLGRLLAICDMEISGSLPLGYWADHFKHMTPPKKYRIQQEHGCFPRGCVEAAPLDLDEWVSIVTKLSKEDCALAERLDANTAVVVNGEGSIHHNLPRALALLALVEVAVSRGKRVALINTTLQGMSMALLRRVLPPLEFCHFREDSSLDLVASSAPCGFVAPDLALLSLRNLPAPQRAAEQRGSRKCLISAGVVGNELIVRQIIAAVRECELQPIYLMIGDGGEREVVARVCGEERVPVVDSGIVSLERLTSIICSAGMAVSGRHHINLFLMHCGVPFLPLPSNTWKIEGALRLMGYPVKPLHCFDELTEGVRSVYANREALAAFARQAASRGQEQSRMTIDRFRQWSC